MMGISDFRMHNVRPKIPNPKSKILNTGNSPSFLNGGHPRLLFFGGKGGVGKTTCATATALKLAGRSPNASFLLVSTDPAHSLADSMADSPFPPNLEILELDAQECLSNFKSEHNEKLREIASRGTFFDDEDINQVLELSLPGLDELMAFLEISRWVEDKRYDCIVVDTAPTGHTLRLLAMPELIRKWLDALDALLAKHRYIKKLFKGSYQRDELDQFLLGLFGSVKKMNALLRDPVGCRFVPVTLAEELSIRETVNLLEELKRSKIPVTDIVVNRLYSESTCKVCSDRRAQQIRELGELPEKLSDYSFWGVPVHLKEIRGADTLNMFWENVSTLEIPKSPIRNPKSEIPKFLNSPIINHQSSIINPKSKLDRMVELPGNFPSPETKLLILAGKGGVGKTTPACATALRMARDLWDKEVLLFSTDPAHSLSACLEAEIGPEETRLAPGLTVMEIDAQAEFETLKKQYAQELERFLGAVSHNLDLTFDREVMERIMDLSPPGLDEVMALTLAMEFLAQGRYDVFILDSAPTGHLIRLLETPELIDQWLKLFFNLFLKYKRVFRLPKISERLVQISKQLKRLRALLNDPGRSAVCAVSILTEMAFQETVDLVAACERMGVSVPILFLNLATPASECPLCSAHYLQESQIRGKFQETFPKKQQPLVYAQGELRGMQRLEELGEALYKPITGKPEFQASRLETDWMVEIRN